MDDHMASSARPYVVNARQPSHVVGCDPDTQFPSYAYLRDSELQSVLYQVAGPRVAPPYPRSATCVIEAQFVRMAGSKIPVQDILDLAWAAGECSMHFDSVQRVKPGVWKGNVPKNIHQEWVKDTLNEQERAVLAGLPKYKLVEILDAVGIALWRVGRLR